MTFPAGIATRYRVISDNDYSGDPDGLYQLAHALLSPTIDVVTVIGSHLARGFDDSGRTADNASEAARTIAELAGRSDVPVVAGSNDSLTSRTEPIRSAAAEAIVAHAMADNPLPLFVTCGGGLTDIASAWLMEPAIAERLTLVWIGGPEYDGLATPPPNPDPMEYNLSTDVLAAQVVFNDSDLRIWQIPRDAYRQTAVGLSEIELRVRGVGPLGDALAESLDHVNEMVRDLGWNLGETYLLGDSPLVLVTALQSNFHPDASSCRSVILPRPTITDDGSYGSPTTHEVRVFTHIDTRLMFEDMIAKLALLARS